MKILTVVYSLSGNNKRLANYLKENTNCEIFEIKTNKKMGFFAFLKGLIFKKTPKLEEYKLDLKSYDKVIFVSPIWFGKLAFPLKSFFINEKSNIQNYSFLSICLGGQKDKIKNELTSILSTKPLYVEEISFKRLIEANKIKLTDKLNDSNFKELQKDIDNAIENIVKVHDHN